MRFFLNHGFLGVTTQFQWRTVDGGSREYVQRLTAPFRDRIHLGSPVATVRRDAHGVELVFRRRRSQRFDGVVIAAHADEALAMLEEPTADETRLLGAWSYSTIRDAPPLRPVLPPAPERGAGGVELPASTTAPGPGRRPR